MVDSELPSPLSAASCVLITLVQDALSEQPFLSRLSIQGLLQHSLLIPTYHVTL